MKFGLFDHVDRSNRPLADQLDQRIEFVAAAEKADFHCYHVAEHHATPLNMVPVPGVFLGAVAHATRRIRLGPLVYLLTLYSPLRLIEEICILDHLCRGRLDVGVGRGISPFELNYHNIDFATTREVFLEALDAVIYGLTHPTLSHAGKHFTYANVPMELRPLQTPCPPIWYPSSGAESAAFIGEAGYNFSTLGTVEAAKRCVDAYKTGYAKRNRAPEPPAAFPGGPAIGVNRHIVVAETDAKAKRIAEPAYDAWYASLTKLWRENKVEGPAIAHDTVAKLDDAMRGGSFIVGSPATVRAEIERQAAIIGVNYFVCGMYFGTMAHGAWRCDAVAVSVFERGDASFLPRRGVRRRRRCFTAAGSLLTRSCWPDAAHHRLGRVATRGLEMRPTRLPGSDERFPPYSARIPESSPRAPFLR